MKGYYDSKEKILYIFPQEVGTIPNVDAEAEAIAIQQENLAEWKEANEDYAALMFAYNYIMMTAKPKIWADHLDDDIKEPEPETQNSISGSDFDENESVYGTITVSLEDEIPLVVEYDEEGDEYQPFEVANALYISSGDLTDSEKYSWTKDGEPIEGVLAEGEDRGPLVYTYATSGEDAPMFTVEEDENGTTATITPDTTGEFVATLITEPEPESEEVNYTFWEDVTVGDTPFKRYLNEDTIQQEHIYTEQEFPDYAPLYVVHVDETDYTFEDKNFDANGYCWADNWDGVMGDVAIKYNQDTVHPDIYIATSAIGQGAVSASYNG